MVIRKKKYKILILSRQPNLLRQLLTAVLLPLPFLLQFATLVAQESYIRFKRLTINDGLSLSSVYCIYQDSKGFVWFGTEDGLNRYDGNNFTIFRADPLNKNSISYKWTELIFEDNLGNLWFGSRGGLTGFNPSTETFRQYRHDASDAFTLSNDTITVVTQDSTGRIWAGTFDGLNMIDPKTNTLTRIAFPESDVDHGSNHIYALISDVKGNLWIGCSRGLFMFNGKTQSAEIPAFLSENQPVTAIASDGGSLWTGTSGKINRYDPAGQSGTSYHFESIPGHENVVVETIFIDRNSMIWAGTPYGLFRLDDPEKKFILVIRAFDSSGSLSVKPVKPLIEDSKGLLWYGTFGSGLYKIEPVSGKTNLYRNNTADPQSISENSINCIFEDRSGVIWFGTFGAGISIYDPLSNQFDLLRHDPSNPNSLSTNFIWSVFEARDGSVWIGTNNKGLIQYNPQGGTFSFYDHDPGNPNTVASSSVRKIFEDSQGALWIGTDGGGLDRYDRRTARFTHFVNNPADPTTISNNSVRVIFEDKKGMLWIGTRNGLNRFDPQSAVFTRYLHSEGDPQTISNNFIYSAIIQDSGGDLWIGTYGGGLNKMDINSGTFISYQMVIDQPGSISDNIVFSIYEDQQGSLWVGTNSGLNHLDPVSGKFTRYGIGDGLPNEVIYGILPDAQNNIWLSTNLGISQFNLIDHSVRNFDVGDGLQSNEFNGGAYHRGYSGKFYFGGVYGLNVINPEKIMPVINLSEVVFTKVDILGKNLGIATGKSYGTDTNDDTKVISENDQFVIAKSISYTNEIKLDYNQRFISFEFASLNTPPSQKVDFWYKMENMDKDWNFSGKRNYVTYANMEPGSYLFSVITRNSEGAECKTPARLRILIAPPFWDTWWFAILEIIAIASLVIFIYVYLVKTRTNRLLTLQNQQIQAANERLTESERKLQELNATKDKFFSIIAHDLKNPFTSLLSISELLSRNFSELDEDDKISGVRGFHSAAKRIYSLLENLLMWSKAQTGRLRYSPVSFNLSEMAIDNLNLFEVSAEKKGITLTGKIDNDVYVMGDPEMIDLVLRNLVHNAIKYSNNGSEVLIEIRNETDKVGVYITDQGVGISGDKLEKLFTLASESTTAGTAGEKGSGLGLIVCKEFIDRHGCEIQVISEAGKGSTFGFWLKPSGEKI